VNAQVSQLILERAGSILVSLSLALSATLSPVTAVATPDPVAMLSSCGASPATWTTRRGGFPASVDFNPVMERAWCEEARREIDLARKVLDVLRDDMSRETDAYLTALDGALGRMSVEPRLHELPALTSALRLARERLEVDATTYGRWSRVARAVCPDPDKGLRVPERFIVRSAPEAEPPLLVDEAELRVQRAVRAFWEQYADPPSS